MDLAIYTSILKWRGENPYEMVESDTNKSIRIGEKVFRQDILHNKCVWVNKQKQDFIYFIESRHPLISCFLCPEKHPYSKQERRGTLIIMFSLGSFWAFASCLFALYGAESVGLNVEGINPEKEVFILRLLCSIGNGIVLWFCDLSLTKIQSCACAERQENQTCYLLCKVFASMTIWIYFAISIIIFSFSLYMVIILKLIYMFLMVFSLQFICSWIFQFIALYLRFKKLWIRDHKMIDDINQKSIYYLTYKDYEEYRYSNKLDIISPSTRNKHKSNQSGSIDKGPLLLQIDQDIDNEDDIIIHSQSEESKFSF